MEMTRLYLLTFLIGIILTACITDAPTNDELNLSIPPVPDSIEGPFTIEGANLLKDNKVVHYKGVNAMQSFGLVNPALMNEWNVQIVREFIGNLREQPIDGNAIQASDGVWYHPLQNIVDQNRTNNKITILCPFGWVDINGQQTLLTGLNPSSQPFYQSYKIKMRQIAEHFKNQPDVWIQVWNEPYHWNNENSYFHELWLDDMIDMVDNLRWIDGFHNIIIVPGNEQGQSEDAIIAKGDDLLKSRYNLLFDLHVYEKWLANTTEEELVNRLENLKSKNFAFIIGEVGVQNAGRVMRVKHFLNAVKTTEITVLAWLWNRDSSYNNALLTNDGLPNSTVNNNYWGLKYKEFLQD